MNTQITEGPWVAENIGADGWGVRAPITLHGMHGTGIIIRNLTEGNARFICAAHEGLKFARDFIGVYGSLNDGIEPHLVEQARKFIFSATGEKL